MEFRWAGHTIRFTEAIHDDHIFVDRDGVVWFGNGGLMWNVYSHLLRDSFEVEESLCCLICKSRETRRSIKWTACVRS